MCLLKIFYSAIFFTSTEESPSSASASEASRRINDGSEEKCKLEQQCIREVGGKKDNFFASAAENRSSSFWTHGSSSHFDGIRMHTQSLSCTSHSYFCHYSDVKSRVCIRAAVLFLPPSPIVNSLTVFPCSMFSDFHFPALSCDSLCGHWY